MVITTVMEAVLCKTLVKDNGNDDDHMKLHQNQGKLYHAFAFIPSINLFLKAFMKNHPCVCVRFVFSCNS